jgi:imidazoleglycerol phosphate dehydratase HisB
LMRDAKEFGRELAARMIKRMQIGNVPAEQALRTLAVDLAGQANRMVARGRGREDVARWIGEVQTSCAQHVQENLCAASERKSKVA